MRIIAVCLLSLICTACSIYNSEFDCPPGKGIGCKPVSEVLDLIVEKEEGEDLFVQDRGAAMLLRDQQKKKHRKAKPQTENKKLYLMKERAGEPVLVEAKEVAP